MNFDKIYERHHANDAGFCRHYLTLYSIVLGMEAKNAFEFGSGYSSVAILEALKLTNGRLTSCDPRPLELTGHKYSVDEEILKYGDSWKYIQKRSSEGLKDISGEIFDFVLHDGAHDPRTVNSDLKAIVPRMKKGSLLLIHDTAHPTENYGLDRLVENLNWFKNERMTLPYGYGLTIIKVLEDYGHGEVKISWKKV